MGWFHPSATRIPTARQIQSDFQIQFTGFRYGKRDVRKRRITHERRPCRHHSIWPEADFEDINPADARILDRLQFFLDALPVHIPVQPPPVELDRTSTRMNSSH